MRDVIIWTPSGCWYQREFGGQVRLSCLGEIGREFAVREYCREHDIDFVVHHSKLKLPLRGKATSSLEARPFVGKTA